MTLLYESYSFEPRKRMRVTKRFATPTILLTTVGRIVNGVWEGLEGKTVPVGTEVRISGTLYTDAYAMVGPGKTINIWRKFDDSFHIGYEIIGTVMTDDHSNFHFNVTLNAVGTHTFRCEFPGDSDYEGC